MHMVFGIPYFASTLALMPPILFAQQTYAEPQLGAGQLLGGVIGYIIGAFLTWKIYQRLNLENAWFAWIPILGAYINFVAGDEENPILWTVLLFVPCINIVAVIKLIIAWVRICNKLGKSPWLLLLALIPFGAIFVLGYLAFG
ncbi:MAG: hypothetical protein VKL39_03385 [Leptolyngbyaceae bacterium]|nr:hypothetical protein [Leptolyngbyaceae bacterium]